MEISTGVHIIPGTMANSYLIEEGTGLILIDTGLPGNSRKILNYIESLGYQAVQIKHIIITHSDDDHYGSLAMLKAKTNAVTYAAEAEAKAIAKGTSSRTLKITGVKKILFRFVKPFVRARSVKIDIILQDGESLPFLGGLIVVKTPGHTPEHIALFSPCQGILFAGDAMRSTGEDLVPSQGMNTWDEEEAIISVKKLARLGARIVCVGHGPVIYEAQDKFPNFNGHVN